jgi:hypothetical protein
MSAYLLPTQSEKQQSLIFDITGTVQIVEVMVADDPDHPALLEQDSAEMERSVLNVLNQEREMLRAEIEEQLRMALRNVSLVKVALRFEASSIAVTDVLELSAAITDVAGAAQVIRFIYTEAIKRVLAKYELPAQPLFDPPKLRSSGWSAPAAPQNFLRKAFGFLLASVAILLALYLLWLLFSPIIISF